MSSRSLALTSRLPGLNEVVTRSYSYHTTVLEKTEDKPRISKDRYYRQMAAIVVQIRAERGAVERSVAGKFPGATAPLSVRKTGAM